MVDPSSIGRYIKALTYPDSLNGRKPEERSRENSAEIENGLEEKRDSQASGENGNRKQ